jgi:hypothetical protein
MIHAIWENKDMPPRVQVFGWRLLRKAIPTGVRAAARSINIDHKCCRCGMDETDFHLFFSCHYVHAVWFASPLGLRVEGLLQQGIDQVEDALHHLMTSYKTDNSIAMIFNILWSIWKARNDLLFNNKQNSPLQVLYAAKALLNAGEGEFHKQDGPDLAQATVSNSNSLVAFDRNMITEGPNIYTDAAWKNPSPSSSLFAGIRAKAGIGIFMQWLNQGDMQAVLVQATSMADSALVAEAQALELAAHIGHAMKVQHPNFLTDNQVLAQVATKRDPVRHPGHWTIRPNLHQFVSYTQGNDAKVFKINRESNKIAHKQAQDAFYLQNFDTSSYSCLGSTHDASSCPVKAVLSSLNVQSCTLLLVSCL